MMQDNQPGVLIILSLLGVQERCRILMDFFLRKEWV